MRPDGRSTVTSSELTASQLNLLQAWFSPAFPVGSFAYSHGLENAVAEDLVTSPQELGDWIATVLIYGSGRTDGVLFRETYIAMQACDFDALYQTAELAAALLPTAELALECKAQGEAFISAIKTVWPTQMIRRLALEKPAFAVSAAAACAAHGLPLHHSLLSWYHAFATSLVSAGVRLIPLGQTDGLKVIAKLAETIQTACRQAQIIDVDAMGTAAPLLEISSLHHETQYTRLFRS